MASEAGQRNDFYALAIPDRIEGGAGVLYQTWDVRLIEKEEMAITAGVDNGERGR